LTGAVNKVGQQNWQQFLDEDFEDIPPKFEKIKREPKIQEDDRKPDRPVSIDKPKRK
jgi:hypothetical protein